MMIWLFVKKVHGSRWLRKYRMPEQQADLNISHMQVKLSNLNLCG